jgi:hypothetical protein
LRSLTTSVFSAEFNESIGLEFKISTLISPYFAHQEEIGILHEELLLLPQERHRLARQRRGRTKPSLSPSYRILSGAARPWKGALKKPYKSAGTPPSLHCTLDQFHLWLYPDSKLGSRTTAVGSRKQRQRIILQQAQLELTDEVNKIFWRNKRSSELPRPSLLSSEVVRRR